MDDIVLEPNQGHLLVEEDVRIMNPDGTYHLKQYYLFGAFDEKLFDRLSRLESLQRNLVLDGPVSHGCQIIVEPADPNSEDSVEFSVVKSIRPEPRRYMRR